VPNYISKVLSIFTRYYVPLHSRFVSALCGGSCHTMDANRLPITIRLTPGWNASSVMNEDLVGSRCGKISRDSAWA